MIMYTTHSHTLPLHSVFYAHNAQAQRAPKVSHDQVAAAMLDAATILFYFVVRHLGAHAMLRKKAVFMIFIFF
jgi:hypothetical protein